MRYYQQSIAENDPHFKELQEMARSLESDLAVGIVEKEVKSRYELDVAGHYNRPDIFSFRVNLPDEN